MRSCLTTPAVAGLVFLAACQPADTGGATPGEGAAAPAAAPGWNAADACSLVSKEEVAAAAGAAVTETQLTGLTQGDGLATHSTCLYSLAQGGTISLLARRAPTADATAAAIEQARTMGGAASPAEDVPGLGKAALWTADMRTLQVFIDDTRYVTLNMIMPKGDAKAILTAVAQKAID